GLNPFNELRGVLDPRLGQVRAFHMSWRSSELPLVYERLENLFLLRRDQVIILPIGAFPRFVHGIVKRGSEVFLGHASTARLVNDDLHRYPQIGLDRVVDGPGDIRKAAEDRHLLLVWEEQNAPVGEHGLLAAESGHLPKADGWIAHDRGPELLLCRELGI